MCLARQSVWRFHLYLSSICKPMEPAAYRYKLQPNALLAPGQSVWPGYFLSVQSATSLLLSFLQNYWPLSILVWMLLTKVFVLKFQLVPEVDSQRQSAAANRAG